MDNIALEFKDVTGKGFGFKLKNVSMTLENGYIYAVTGKNGAGKTTLFNYILTEKKRYTGSIKLSVTSLLEIMQKQWKSPGWCQRIMYSSRTVPESRMLTYWDLCMMILMWNCLMNV